MAVSADALHIAVVILSFVYVRGIVGVIVDAGSVKNTSH